MTQEKLMEETKWGEKAETGKDIFMDAIVHHYFWLQISYFKMYMHVTSKRLKTYKK